MGAPTSFPSSPPQPPRRRARRHTARLSLVATALALGLLGYFAPALLGRWVLQRVTEDVTAERIGGPVWNPVLHGTRVELPGITARAERLGVRIEGINPSRKFLYVSVTLEDADVALQLAELARKGESAVTTEEGWQVQLREITVSDTSLELGDRRGNIPDGTFSVGEADDGVTVEGRTGDGDLSARLRLEDTPEGTRYVTTFSGDARILRFYWQGVEAGQLVGEYRFGAGGTAGTVRLSGGVVQVPEADWATFMGVAGTLTQRDDAVKANLTGEGFGNPVTLGLVADLQAKRWNAKLNATPELEALADALGTAGAGEATLAATAGNAGPDWGGVWVAAQARAGAGELAAIPFSRLNLAYRFEAGEAGEDTAKVNRVSLDADTTLQGQQHLGGAWNFGGAGLAASQHDGSLLWRGDLLGAPLNVRANIDRQMLGGKAADIAALSGRALGGPLAGRAALSGQLVDVTVRPQLEAVRGGRVRVEGAAGDLTFTAHNLEAAGLSVSGTARMGKAGLSANLRGRQGGELGLSLSPDYAGTWQVRGLQLGGAALSGSGEVDVQAGKLGGTASVASSLLAGTLSGPLNLNWKEEQADWDPGAARLRWQGERVGATLRGLELSSGLSLSGNASSNLSLDDVRGQVQASGNGLSATATGQGGSVAWNGRLRKGGIRLSGETQLAGGFATTATVRGADIDADVEAAGSGGIRFRLRTGRQQASGVLAGLDPASDNWNAAGKVDLAALRPLASSLLGADNPAATLRGTVGLNLAGTGGTLRLDATTDEFAAAGDLVRNGGTLRAKALRVGGKAGELEGFSAVASGEVYPAVDLRGPVTLGAVGGVQGLAGQRLQAHLWGSYGALQVAARGRLGRFSAGGAELPAQSVQVTGRLTPDLNLTGQYGDLDLAYLPDTGLSLRGQQKLTFQGRSGVVAGSANIGPSFAGRADLSGTLAGGYRLSLRGPWDNLRVNLQNASGLQAGGQASLPDQSYSVQVSGQAEGYLVSGKVSGQGLSPVGNLTLTDSAGGRATVELNGLDDVRLQAGALQLAGQTWSGNLRSVGGLASGSLSTRVGGETLTLTASRGQVRLRGQWQGHTLGASGRLRLPSSAGGLELDGLRVNVAGPYLAAQAQGSLEAGLAGSVTVQPQTFGQESAELLLPQQTLPLRADLQPLALRVGGLTYAGGTWRGAAGLRYVVRGEGDSSGGQLQLAGTGAGLSAVVDGPLSGKVALLPQIGGHLQAETAVLRPFLPQNAAANLRSGRVVAQITASGADVRADGVQWAAAPLGLSARVGWGGGVTAAGLLTHAETSLPFQYGAGELDMQGAVLDAATLRPLADLDAAGTLRGNLHIADVSAVDATLHGVTANLKADLRPRGRGGDALQGRLRVAGGRVWSDLTGSYAGEALAVRGNLYPNTDAALQLGDLRGTLTGRARGTLRLTARGQYAGRAVDAQAELRHLLGGKQRSEASLRGTVSGAQLDVQALEAGASLSNWKLRGSLLVPDAGTLSDGLTGHVSASLGGRVGRATMQAEGVLNGATFTAPATFAGGALRVQAAQAFHPELGQVQASGQVFPTLNLSGTAELTGDFAGHYALTAEGQPSDPLLTLQGQLAGAAGQMHPSGLNLGGTAVDAWLRGGAWRARLSGAAVRGSLSGRLGAEVDGAETPLGLQRADLNLSAHYAKGTDDITLTGPLTWSRAGWRGAVTAAGTLGGERLNATALGAGPLSVSARLGGAALSAELGALAPARPSGWVKATAWDVGALWNRAGELRFTGRADLAGSSWQAVQARVRGHLDDRLGDLNGKVAGQLSRSESGEARARLQLSGQAVQATATLEGGHYTARAELGRAELGRAPANSSAAPLNTPVQLARLLPENLGLSELEARGRIDLTGDLSQKDAPLGLSEARLSRLRLRGVQGDTGRFTLAGNAVYQPKGGVLDSNLAGTYGGGVVRAVGSLPTGLKITARDVSLSGLAPEGWNLGQLAGTATLRGPLEAARVSGELETSGPDADSHLTLGGTLQRPRAFARARLHSEQARGLVYAEASHFDLTGHTAQLSTHGKVQAGGAAFDFDLGGAWPQLGGEATVRSDALAAPLTLEGESGRFKLGAGAAGGGQLSLSAGAGWLPTVQAQATLNAAELLEAVGGTAQLEVQAGGPAGALNLQATLDAPNLVAGGAAVQNLSGQVSGSLAEGLGGLSGAFFQQQEFQPQATDATTRPMMQRTATQPAETQRIEEAQRTQVAALQGGQFTLAGLQAQAAGSKLAVSGPAELSPLRADLQAEVSGTLAGTLALNYAAENARSGPRLSLGGNLSGAGYAANLDVTGSEQGGWKGTLGLQDTQGGTEVLTAPATLQVSGPWNTPRLSGTLGLLDAAATLSADAESGATLTLASTPRAEASGLLTVQPAADGWQLGGEASVRRRGPGTAQRLKLAAKGSLARPTFAITAQRGTWRVVGAASPQRGLLTISESGRAGQVEWRGQNVSTDLPALDLGGLGWRGLAGTVTAKGSADLAAGDGALPFSVTGLRAPYRVDALGVQASGDISGTVRLEGGRPALAAQGQLGGSLPDQAAIGTATDAAAARGPFSLNLRQSAAGDWLGTLKADLTAGTEIGAGTLSADLTSHAGGLTGTLSAENYPVQLAAGQLAAGQLATEQVGAAGGQEATALLSGNAKLSGQTFNASLSVGGRAAAGQVSASGSLGAALPMLTGLTRVQASNADDYSLNAALTRLDMAELGLLQNTAGTLSGEVEIAGGAGQFVARTGDLNVAGQDLPSRFEGTLIGDDWRIRGYLGSSDVFAGVSSGVLSGRASLEGLPLGAFANALAGRDLADGRVTGLARFEAPLSDPAAGHLQVVAERIRLTTTPPPELGTEPETLTGYGSLDYQGRELRNIDVQLGGAGTWDVRGQYTRGRVGMQANFTGTTFTPLLALIPSLAGNDPSLQGNLSLTVGGTYSQPTATLGASNLRGSLAGTALNIPTLRGELGAAGKWTLGGQVLSGGSLVSAGKLSGSGEFVEGQLRGAALSYAGDISPKALGQLPNVQATLRQQIGDPSRWQLSAQSVTPPATPTSSAGRLSVEGQLLPAWNLQLTAQNYNLPAKSLFVRESALNASLTAREDVASGQIRVRGAADFARLLMGRPDATSDLDSLVPGSSAGDLAGVADAANTAGGGVPYQSPLPEQYTTFAPAEGSEEEAAQQARSTPSLFQRLRLEDIPVTFSGGITLDESLAQADATGALTVSGTLAQPQVAGELNATRGVIYLRDNPFNIQMAQANFNGETAYPDFELVALGRISDSSGGGGNAVPVQLNVAGEYLPQGGGQMALDMTTTLSCGSGNGPDSAATADFGCLNPATDQPYTESELYALVLTGVANVNALPGELGGLGASALNTALNVYVLGEFSRSLADALGVDVLRFTPALLGEGGATLTVGSQLTENLYLEYQVDLMGRGVIDATYTTPDRRFTFTVKNPINLAGETGFNPTVSAAYNLSNRTSLSLGFESGQESTRINFGVRYRLPRDFGRQDND